MLKAQLIIYFLDDGGGWYISCSRNVDAYFFQELCPRWTGRQLENVVGHLLLSCAHTLKEGNERHESILVLGLAELLHQSLGLFLGQLLTKVGQQPEELISKHGVVVIFVVELQDLNEVMESTLVLGVLAGLVHGEDVSLLEHLLALLGGASDLLDGVEGGVEVACTDEVAGIEGINISISLEVIDIEGEFDSINFLFL